MDIKKRSIAELENRISELENQLNHRKLVSDISQENNKMGTWEVDLEGETQEWSKNYCALLGYPQQVENPTPDLFYSHVHPDDVELVKSRIDASMAAKTPCSLEFRFITKQKELRFCKSTANFIYNADGAIIKIVGVFHDITEKRILEDALLKASKDFSKYSGNEFYDKVCEYLTISLRVDIAFLAEVDSSNEAHVITGFEGKSKLKSFSYKLKSTPCQNVSDGDVCYYENNVQTIFPEDRLLVDMEVSAYAGIPILNNENKAIGILVVLHRKQLKYAKLAARVLQVFGHIIAAELQREEYDKALLVAKEKAVSNEKLYLSFIQNLQAGVVVHASDTSVIYNNSLAEELLRLSSDQMKGKKAPDPKWKFVYEDFTKVPVEDYPVVKVLKNKAVLRHEIYGVSTVGDKVTWLVVNGFPFFDKEGNITQVIISFIDISTQKQNELLLKQKNAELDRARRRAEENEIRFKVLYDNSPDMYVSVSSQTGNILFCNKTFLLKTGYSEEEIVGASIFSVYHKDSLAYAKEVSNEYNEKGAVSNKELVLLKKDGGAIDVSLNVNAVRDEQGNMLYSMSSWRDITALKQMEREQRVLGRAVEQSPVAIVVTNVKGEIEYVNPSFSSITGYSFEEVRGENSKVLKSGKHSDSVYLEMRDTILQGEVWSGEIINKRKDDSFYWVSITISPVFNELKEIVQFVAVSEDITQRKEQLQRLERHSKLQSDAQTMAKLGYWIYDIKEQVFEAADVCYEMHEAYVGVPLSEIISKVYVDDVSHFKQIFGDWVKGDTSQNLKYRVKHSNGDMRFIHSSCRVEKNNSGEIVRLVGSAQDSSGSKLQELELIESNKRFQTLVENVPGAIYLCNNDKVYSMLYLNDNIEVLTGYSKSDFLSQKINLTDIIDKEHLQLVYNAVNEAVETKTKFHFQYKLKQKSGNVIWVEEFGSGVYDGDKLLFLEGIMMDITDRFKKSEELVKAKEKAEESDRLKTAFLSNMSHEIRTPMNGIVGFTDLLQRPNLKQDKQKQYVSIIKDCSVRLLDTVNDIVEVSKIESGNLYINRENVDILKILKQIIAFFKPECDNKGVRLLLENENVGKELFYDIDETKLNSIITNLIKNAIKFTHKGSITTGLKIKNDELTFYCCDTGIGIPENRQKAVFNRFEQADIEDEKVYEGSGLGLSIVKSYVEKLGGEIKLESEQGTGSSFYVVFPYPWN